MTAHVDGLRGTGDWFVDALSGPTGMADPAPTMPVLDVYPDAMSSPMPSPTAIRGPAAAADAAATAPAAAGAVAIAAAARIDPRTRRGEGTGQRPAAGSRGPGPSQTRWQPTTPPGIAGPRGPARPAPAVHPAAGRPGSPAPMPALAAPIGGPSLPWQGRAMSAADVMAAVRQHLPTTGSGAPTAWTGSSAAHQYVPTAAAMPHEVAPAPVYAGQSLTNRQLRTQANQDGSGGRRRSGGSSVVAVVIFLAILLFATGLGERVIEVFQAVFGR